MTYSAGITKEDQRGKIDGAIDVHAAEAVRVTITTVTFNGSATGLIALSPSEAREIAWALQRAAQEVEKHNNGKGAA